MSRRALGERISRRIARLALRGFDEAEAENVIRDLKELAATRGPIGRAVYFWFELMKYPACGAWDRLRHREEDDSGRRLGGGGMDSLVKDIRYAVRSLARNAGFSVMTIAIMMLSMGSATAIFSVVKGVLLDPLPVHEPDRLVSFWLGPVEGPGRSRMTPGNFGDISELDGVFSTVAAFTGRTTSLLLDEESHFMRGGAVTPGYFETLGVQPVIGRSFRTDEGESGGPDVVILSHRLWRQQFAGDPAVLGALITLDGSGFEVIGVAPPGVFPTQATVSAELPFTASNQDFFVPLRYGEAGWANRRSHLLGAIGRLAPGMSAETADAALQTLGARLRESEPLNQGERFVMTAFADEVVGDVRLALLTLLGSVALVLLIAVVNVGALFLLRTDDRRGELSIRSALGAPRNRLLRQLALESLAIVAVSAAGAVVVAQVALDLMRRLVPYQVPRLAEVEVDGVTLAITVGIALGVGTLFAMAPLFLASVRGVGAPSHRRGQTAGTGQRRLQSSVVAVQAALAVIVLVGAALFTRSYVALRAVDTGFDAHQTWTMSVPGTAEMLEEIVQNVRTLPGVASAAIAYDHPLARSWSDGFLIEGVELSDTDDRPGGSLRPFGEDYFETVGITVSEGRVPDRIDMAGSVAYAVINETLRDRWFPSGGAIGSRIILPTAQRMGMGDGAFEVIAVVRDVRFLGPDQPVSPAFYVPLSHFPTTATNLLVRPERADAELLPAIRRVVRETDASLAVQQAQPLSNVLDDLLARPRFNMMLLLSFGVMGLTLCGLGAYGLVGRVVVMRFKEIGIRMALGADRAGLARSVMSSALRPMLAGTLVGLGVAFAMAGLLRSALFEISPTDPLSMATSAVFVLSVGAVAAVVPTLRGLSVNPASTLRNE